MKKHLAHLAAALAVTLLFGAAAGPLSAAAAAPTAILDEENTAAAESRLNQSWLDLEIEYNDLHPVYQLYLSSAAPDDWVYQWYSTNPAVATVDRNGLVTAQQPGKATIVANTYTTTLRHYRPIQRQGRGRVSLFHRVFSGSHVACRGGAECHSP